MPFFTLHYTDIFSENRTFEDVKTRDVNRATTNLTARCGPRAVRIVVYYFVFSICVFSSCLVTDSLVCDFSGVNERSSQE